jgi:hypothetical protein
MSKTVGADITCRQCGMETPMQLFRTLWLEDDKNRGMVYKDCVNLFKCPHCGHTERVEFPFLATNKDKKYAVWYEPYHDEAIDKDVAMYKEHMGPTSYFARAPRIADWNEFKAKVQEFEEVQGSEKPSGVEFSPEIETAFQSFTDEIKAQKGRSKHQGSHASINYWKWSKRLWFVLSIIWIAVLASEVWEVRDLIGATTKKIVNVSIETEVNTEVDKTNPFLMGEYMDLPFKKPVRDSAVFKEARTRFPSKSALSDDDFSLFLWNKISEAAKYKRRWRQRDIDVANARLRGLLILGPVIPLLAFLLMLAVRWHLRKFPISQYSTYTKKVIAAVVTWELAAYAWIVMFNENGNFEYAFENAYSTFYLLPPIVIVVGAVLWRWANRSQSKV